MKICLPQTRFYNLLALKTATRLLLLFFIAAAMPVVAAAYTLVMRDQRHIVVPAQFVLSGDYLVYEASPGITVTVRLANIDVAATEKLNGEAPGNFLRRLKVDAPRAHKKRTLTDADLADVRRLRRQKEQESEQRRRALGLPSPATARQQIEQQDQALQEVLSASEDRQAETYWRTRAGALRAEILAVDGQINFLRTRLVELNSNAGSLRSYGVIAGFGGIFTPPVVSNNNIGSFAARPNTLLPNGTRLNSGLLRGTGAVAPTTQFGNWPRRGTFGRYPRHPSYGSRFIFAAPYNFTGYEYGALTVRLQELETTRAGLHARWRALEEEARRAGAPPGWLRS